MLKTIIYIKKDKKRIDGTCPIFIKIKLDTKSMTVSTGKHISVKRWRATKNLKSILRDQKEKVIKESLDLQILKIEKIYNQIEKFEGEVNFEEFRFKVLGLDKKEAKPTILKIMTQHNEHFKKLVDVGERAPASYQKYERIKYLVRLFNLKTYNKEDILIEDIKSSYVYKLEDYLKFESVYKGKKGIGNNSVVKYFKNLKTMANFAIKMDVIEKNPFDCYGGKIKTVETVFLTQDELNRIENKTFWAERLERVKDIFLFSCYTGYAPVDAMKLTMENIIEDANNNLWIKTNRQKSSIKANVPVLPPVLKIIKKYADDGEQLLPKLSNQKMNAYLKEIADACKINKYLTWYVARHTFATTVTLGNGIKIENVSAMMGHTSIKMTEHYAKVLDSNVMDDMSKLFDKFK